MQHPTPSVSKGSAMIAVSKTFPAAPGETEAALLSAARIGDEAAVRALIQRNNQRLFRVARSVLRNDAEAEDVVQETYVRAFTRLADFEGRSAFSTWLTRIALNEALGRLRRRRPTTGIDHLDAGHAGGAELIPFPGSPPPANPESETARGEMKALLEELVDGLPVDFRTVFVLREVEDLSTEEVAAHLSIKPATVKTRLFRAKRQLREAAEARFSEGFASLYPFDGARCTRLGDRVVVQLALQSEEAGSPPPP
jgi:RNA polymerase sigma-70 factor (ECF subfamily)